MLRLVVALGVLAACGASEELEEKVAGLEKELGTTRRELEQRLDDLEQDGKRLRALERKVEELQRIRAAPPPPPPIARKPAPDPAVVYAIRIAGAPVLGPADAKVTLVLAYDYACVHCSRMQEALVRLREHPVLRTELRVVFRQLVIHPRTAMVPAMAACAANKQGKFAAMDRLLWKSFEERRSDDDLCYVRGTCTVVNEHVRALGLASAKFQVDMRACRSEIADDMRDLARFGVVSTPSYFINGRFGSGFRSYDDLLGKLTEELRTVDARIAAGTSKAGYYQKWVLDTGLPELDAPPP